MYIIRKSILLIGFAFLGGNIFAQQAVNSAGKDIIETNGSVSYSVGITSYTTIENDIGSISQGVQHSYSVFALNTESFALKERIKVYPNPTKDYLVFTITDFDTDSYCNMIDVNGKTILTKKIKSNKTTLDMRNLPSSVYLLKIYKKNKKAQIFKIIKN